MAYRVDLVEKIKLLKESDLPYEFQYPQCYTAPDFEGRTKRYQAWLSENKVYHYGRPKEDFFRYEAYELAEAAGCTSLIMEDLS
jgi:hypothetical protein